MSCNLELSERRWCLNPGPCFCARCSLVHSGTANQRKDYSLFPAVPFLCLLGFMAVAVCEVVVFPSIVAKCVPQQKLIPFSPQHASTLLQSCSHSAHWPGFIDVEQKERLFSMHLSLCVRVHVCASNPPCLLSSPTVIKLIEARSGAASHHSWVDSNLTDIL